MFIEWKVFIEKLCVGRLVCEMFFGFDFLMWVIFVFSGKGGVGKLIVMVNFVVVFVDQGLLVGFVDVDVYGFLIFGLFGILFGIQLMWIDDFMLLLVVYGVKMILIGMFFCDGEFVVVWCGLMLYCMVFQFFMDVFFGDFDVFFIDMLLGIGDIVILIG